MTVYLGCSKTYKLVLRGSALVDPKSAPPVHPRVHFLKISSFFNCFPSMPLNRTKVKYGAMILKNYENFLWIAETSAVSPQTKGLFLVDPESSL